LTFETTTDVIVLGAGAAGMMCAIEAGRRGLRVLVLDHAKAPGEKIRISGGGRCNFTNMHCGPKNFLSQNPYFAISALKAYTPQDFVAQVKKRGIAFHEKALGQLFCDGSAREIITMLTDAMAEVGAKLLLETQIHAVSREGDEYCVETSMGPLRAPRLVVATGGKSIPKMGATSLGYDLARQFGHAITDTRPALVPFTWPANMLESWGALSGVSLPVRASCHKGVFDEAMLMTHRGISGPAMLQVSSYWREGDGVDIDLLPGVDVAGFLKAERIARPKTAPATALADIMPKRLAQQLGDELKLVGKRLTDLNNAAVDALAGRLKRFTFTPGGTEGYRTAEVTLGGVETDALNQKTMESKHAPGLFFIGEVVDVTGHLGGHNFQWAWASGVAAGRYM
jgi:predicted Rossmann fold flavoprotein